MSDAESKSPTPGTLMIKGAAVDLLSGFLSILCVSGVLGRCGGSGVSETRSLRHRHGLVRTHPASRGALRFAESTCCAQNALSGFFPAQSRSPVAMNRETFTLFFRASTSPDYTLGLARYALGQVSRYRHEPQFVFVGRASKRPDAMPSAAC